MKKVSIIGCIIALVLACVAGDAYGQRRPGQRRLPQGQRNLEPRPGLIPGGRLSRLTPEKKRLLQQQLMREIGLTENQRLRMVEIQRSHEDELIASGRRVRQARQALDRAIRSEQYDEARINQYIEEMAAAQANQIRLQARIRAQKRSVLTSDQVFRLNLLEQRLRRQMREQQRRESNENPAEDQPNPRRPGQEEQFDLISFLISGT